MNMYARRNAKRKKKGEVPVKKKKTLSGFYSPYEEAHYNNLYFYAIEGLITDVEKQYRWDLIIEGKKIFQYTIDFKYTNVKHNQIICDECKGFFETDARIRFKAFLAYHNALGWIIRLQDNNKKGKPFFRVLLSPGGRIKYIDHTDGNKEKLWRFS